MSVLYCKSDSLSIISLPFFSVLKSGAYYLFMPSCRTQDHMAIQKNSIEFYSYSLSFSQNQKENLLCKKNKSCTQLKNHFKRAITHHEMKSRA